MRWPKYGSFSFSISPSKEIPGLISFRMDWLDLLAVQGTLKSLLQHHSSKASILRTLPTVFWISEVNLLTVIPLKWDTQQCKLLGCSSLMKSISYDTCLFTTESCDNWRVSCQPHLVHQLISGTLTTWILTHRGRLLIHQGGCPGLDHTAPKGFRLECEPTWPEWR